MTRRHDADREAFLTLAPFTSREEALEVAELNAQAAAELAAENAWVRHAEYDEESQRDLHGYGF